MTGGGADMTLMGEEAGSIDSLIGRDCSNGT